MSSRASVLSLIVFAAASSAFALNNRSAVSVNGNDANPCTPASPCRSFGAALAATAAGGEIIALDSAGYGPFTVPMSVTISGAPGVHAAITVTSGTGINISASGTDRVILRNLVLIGNGGSSGIIQNLATEVRIVGCTIRGFSIYGMSVVAGNISIEETAALDSYFGIALGDYGFAVRGTITNSSFRGNTYGIDADVDSHVTVANSSINGNQTGAMASCGEGSLPVTSDLMLESCVIAHNNGGVISNASGGGFVANLTLSQNVIAYNATGVQISGGNVSSFGNNRFVGNGTDGGPFSAATFQ